MSHLLSPGHTAEGNLEKWLRLVGAGGGGAPGDGVRLLEPFGGPAASHRSEGPGSRNVYFVKARGLELVAGFGSPWRLREPLGRHLGC